jgi:hypothetical protein
MHQSYNHLSGIENTILYESGNTFEIGFARLPLPNAGFDLLGVMTGAHHSSTSEGLLQQRNNQHNKIGL